MNSMPLLVVAKNLGHRDTRMVERHYGHLAPSFVADAGAGRAAMTMLDIVHGYTRRKWKVVPTALNPNVRTVLAVSGAS
jgi:hypothetical protein